MIHDGLDGLDDIPDDLPEADRRRLLGDLDALKGLLSDRRPSGETSAPPPPLPDHAAIPILLEAMSAPGAPAAESPPAPVASRRAADRTRARVNEFQPSLFGDELPTPPEPPPGPRSAPGKPTRSPQDNPYLPQAIKDRLAQSQARATRELRSLLDTERAGPIDRRNTANWQKAQQRVKSRAAIVIQQVMDEHLPQIEQDLRRRLQQELEQALREFGLDNDPPPT